MGSELSGKTAIITGGASGIGAGTARVFVEEGARVVISDVQDEKGEALAAELGDAARYRRADVSDPNDVEALVGFAVDALGGLDIMFNNAGISGDMQHKEFLDEDYAEFDTVMKVDLLGVMNGCRYAGRQMAEAGGGSIINTASTAGFFAGYGIPAYRAAKAGVINYTQNAAMALGRYQIRVNAISPGPIETPIMGSGIELPEAQLEQLSRDIMGVIVEPQALKRFGQPEDIANAAVFLGSDRSVQVTGLNLVVGGGSALGDPIDRTAEMQKVFAAAMGGAG
ncbi:MAG: SDR family oxidoreductase [Pseudomonadota bacterium]